MKKGLLSPAWWKQSETPRYVLAAGALFTVLANFGVSLYLDHSKRESDYRSEQVGLLLKDMAAYQSAVAAFANEAMEKKKVSDATREALIKNLNDQFGHSREIESLVPEDSVTLEKLRREIGDLISALPEQIDNASMKRFWAAVSKVTMTRNSLNKALQTAI